MWTRLPWSVRITEVPNKAPGKVWTLYLRIEPKAWAPGFEWPEAPLTAWTETPSGTKLNMPFTATLTYKRPWVKFVIPPTNADKVVVKAKGWPIAFELKETRTYEGRRKENTPPNWSDRKPLPERVSEAAQEALGFARFGGLLVFVLIIVGLFVLAKALSGGIKIRL